MAGYLEGNAVLVAGSGDDPHRAVAVALAQAGADVAVAGAVADLSAEAALHSIANEIWALGRRSTVVKVAPDDTALEDALTEAAAALGWVALVVRCEPGEPDRGAAGGRAQA